jgi:hypothetical protein
LAKVADTAQLPEKKVSAAKRALLLSRTPLKIAEKKREKARQPKAGRKRRKPISSEEPWHPLHDGRQSGRFELPRATRSTPTALAAPEPSKVQRQQQPQPKTQAAHKLAPTARQSAVAPTIAPAKSLFLRKVHLAIVEGVEALSGNGVHLADPFALMQAAKECATDLWSVLFARSPSLNRAWDLLAWVPRSAVRGSCLPGFLAACAALHGFLAQRGLACSDHPRACDRLHTCILC